MTILTRPKHGYTYALLAIWLTVFAVAIWPFLHYLLWYDELLTYYGATARDWGHFVTGIRYFDFNPPLQYALVRISVRILGDSAFAVRLPFLLAYLGASYLVFRFICRRTGVAFGLIALSLLWASSFLPYAAQARPYALVLLFSIAAFVSWAQTEGKTRWSGAHWMLTAATAGLILSHCFAPACIAAVIVGEIARTCEQRRVDGKIWWSILAPLPLIAVYLPFVAKPGETVYPYPATAAAIALFYRDVFVCIAVPWIFCAAVAMLANTPKQKSKGAPVATRAEWVGLLAGITVQVAPMVYTIHAKIPFHERYGIAVSGYLALLGALLLASFRRKSQFAAILGASMALLYVCAFHIAYGQRTVPKPLVPIPPGVPVVVANGGRFLLFDHYEPADVTGRLYYLTDPSAAAAAQSTAFEEFDHLREAYPIRSQVAPYQDFLQTHHEFAVIAFSDDAYQDWVLGALRRSGAKIVNSSSAPWLYYISNPNRRP